ncbi:hypothetical protein [Burkholderia sp. LMG 13014]|uniref:hypothetical protein n=1 Tax=Burkholderia sp. LMG 13014 TaxID=2709306 RepID=UPI0019651D74|nr:hypothetical protein [Burkholderia sp. LMG 13014]
MGTMNEMADQTAQARINTGFQDGISVIPDPENARYVIETPNDYDVNFVFRGNNKDGTKFAQEISKDKKNVMFAVGLDALANEEDIKNFNFKVRDARTAFARKEREKQAVNDRKELMLTQMAVDKGVKDPTVVLKFGVPTEKVRDENDNVIKDERTGKDKVIPSRIGGEVIGYVKDKEGKISNEQGSYYVLFADVDKKDEIRFLRAIPTNNLLQAGEFVNRDQVIAEKFPVGSLRYVEFDEKWKPKKIAEYKPNNKKIDKEQFAKAEERLKQLSAQPKSPDDKLKELEEQSKQPGGIKLSDLAKATQEKEASKPKSRSKSASKNKEKEFDDIPF